MNILRSLILSLTLLFTYTALAQETAPGPQYLNIFTAHTKIGHAAEYEAAVKSLWMAMGKAGGEFAIFASQSAGRPGDYNFASLLSSMADMDTQGAMFQKLFQQSPGVFAELSTHENSTESNIIAMRPDLSYQPTEPRLSEEEAPFAYLTFLYAQPAHVQGVEEGLKAFGALSKKSGVSDGFGVFQNMTGEGPVYIIRTLARSQADYFTQVEKNNEKMGEEAVAIRNKVGAMLSRIEFDSGFSRPDLSYEPAP